MVGNAASWRGGLWLALWPRRGSPPFTGRDVMNALVVIVAALSFGYLTYAILYPERF